MKNKENKNYNIKIFNEKKLLKEFIVNSTSNIEFKEKEVTKLAEDNMTFIKTNILSYIEDGFYKNSFDIGNNTLKESVVITEVY